MPLPQTVISGDTLKKRWNISSAGILFMLMNHELNTANKLGYDTPAEKASKGEALSLISEDKHDPSTFMYWFEDVLRLEAEYPELRSNDRKICDINELEKRWRLSDDELFDVIENARLCPVDPVSVELDSGELFHLINYQKCITPSDLLYRKSDIKKVELEFEIEHFEEAQQQDPVTDSEKPVIEDGIPTLSFYKNGDRWKMGNPGDEKDLNHLKGFDLIRLLIEHEGKEIDSTQLDNLGKVPVTDTEINNLPHNGSEISNLSETFGNKTGGFIIGESSQVIVDKRAIEDAQKAISYIDEKLTCETDQDERLKLQEKKEQLQQYLLDSSLPSGKGKKFKTSSKGNSRINVRKAIKKALEKIGNEVPEISMYLNQDTIKTGCACIYRPDPSNSVSWKIYPKE